MSVEFSPKAMADLQEIGDYIAEDSPANADTFINKLLDRCGAIDDAPKGYIERPEIGENIRSVAFEHYMIFYSNLARGVRIERVLHGSRDYLNSNFM